MALVALCLVSSGAFGGEQTEEAVQFISDTIMPVAGGTALIYLSSGNSERRETGWRVTDALLVTGLVAGGLKRVIDSPRPEPYQEEKDGFPSGHTALAFALAAAVSERDESLRPWAYGYALAVGLSRRELRRHDWWQVAAGAALGIVIGRKTGQGDWHLVSGGIRRPRPEEVTGGSGGVGVNQLWRAEF
jgi:hypothetical protein